MLRTVPDWGEVALGDSADDDALETVLRSIRWASSPNPVIVTMAVEPNEGFLARLRRFCYWLDARPEQRIAVVAHWVFLKHMFTAHAADPALATNFRNAELRTAALFRGSGKVEL